MMSKENKGSLREDIDGVIDEIESELESSIDNLKTIQDNNDIEEIKAIVEDELTLLEELKDKLY